ncbi:MAG: alpha/beta hydrolase [Actinobacteria bacterium 13_1_20CM_4_69_9]|nr:MAG: alpha/beta hydrolase [Actinobacteria bacterium 13_1_20CM_4_69_9]
MSNTIDRVGRSDTGTTAREPDETGVAVRDGVRLHWESYGKGEPAGLLLPTWSIYHSRHWKLEIPYLARHFRVVTFDGRGNGLSDRPTESEAYDAIEFADDAAAVLDEVGVDAAVIAGVSLGALYGLHFATRHPERAVGALLIAPTIGFIPPDIERPGLVWDEELETYEGWAKYNRYYWLSNWEDFLEFFMGQIFSEPHSTKQIEDGIAFGLDTTPDVIVAAQGSSSNLVDRETAERLLRSVRCPVVVAHGTGDRIIPFERGANVAALTGGDFIEFRGSGHALQAREPVQINLLLRELAERAGGRPPRRRTWTRSLSRTKRALVLSSPIGLGHAWRDVAIADALRRRVPGLEVHWLAQHPVTTVLEARGETIHPASRETAAESDHIDRDAGEHDLHAFQAIRRLDEILCANFMLFHDLVRDEHYDLWIGDEAWELDYYLHENPELKTSPYVWLSDFVGFLPMPSGGEHEAYLTADYNAEMIEHIARRPRVRDLSLFVGEPDDIVPDTFGPGLPAIRDWTERHFDFTGYIPGFDPAALGDRAALRRELGYDDEPFCIVSVGGSGVGAPLLHRVVECLPPELRTIVVTGPRIDPAGVPRRDNVEVRGYVHELYRHLAACDVAVVQGGLTTTMELVAARRPFLSIPLSSHFEQRYHVRRRLDRYGATSWLDYSELTPETLEAKLAELRTATPSYRQVDGRGADRAAELMATLL